MRPYLMLVRASQGSYCQGDVRALLLYFKLCILTLPYFSQRTQAAQWTQWEQCSIPQSVDKGLALRCLFFSNQAFLYPCSYLGSPSGGSKSIKVQTEAAVDLGKYLHFANSWMPTKLSTWYLTHRKLYQDVGPVARCRNWMLYLKPSECSYMLCTISFAACQMTRHWPMSPKQRQTGWRRGCESSSSFSRQKRRSMCQSIWLPQTTCTLEEGGDDVKLRR